MGCTTDTTIKAGSTLWVTAAFFDKDGSPVMPSTITYEVLCLTTGTEINGSGSVATPAVSVEIEITDEENAYLGAGSDDQKRRVVVTGSHADGTQQVETVDFYVRATS